MKDILTAPFVKEMCDTTANMYRLGWDERNGGNISYMLDEAEVREYLDVNNVIRTIPTGFQSVYPGLQSGLGGKQDDGNMAVVQFCLYGIAEFQAVHFGHHHIGYNQIDDRFLQYFQSFHAIGGGQHFIGFGQLPDEKFVHFRIVFHY